MQDISGTVNSSILGTASDNNDVEVDDVTGPRAFQSQGKETTAPAMEHSSTPFGFVDDPTAMTARHSLGGFST